VLDVLALVVIGVFYLGNSLGEVEFFIEEELLVGTVELFDFLWGKSSALEPDFVDSADFGGVSIRHGVGDYVFGNFSESADHGMLPNPTELVNACEPRDDDVVGDGDVPSERGIVRENTVVAYGAIMGNMAVAEKEVVIANSGGGGCRGGAVHGGVFTEGVAVADDEGGGFSSVFEILRELPDCGEGEKGVVAADLSMSINDDV